MARMQTQLRMNPVTILLSKRISTWELTGSGKGMDTESPLLEASNTNAAASPSVLLFTSVGAFIR